MKWRTLVTRGWIVVLILVVSSWAGAQLTGLRIVMAPEGETDLHDPGNPDDYDFWDDFSDVRIRQPGPNGDPPLPWGTHILNERWQVGSWTEHDGRLSTDRVRQVEIDGRPVLRMEWEFDTEYFFENDRHLFKSSAINTLATDFGYGRWETRLKLPAEPGVLGSFFTIDWRDGGNSTRQEIDIEFLTASFDREGGTGEVEFAAHARSLPSKAMVIPLGFDPSEQFHVYAFDITEDRIEWLINGEPIWQYVYADNAITFDAPYTIKLNLWSAHGSYHNRNTAYWIQGGNTFRAPENTPLHYYVDWVRYTRYD